MAILLFEIINNFYSRLAFWFLTWTFCEYWMHRIMHINNPYNFLHYIHQYHHKIPIEIVTSHEYRWPKFSYIFFWFENLNETLEIIIGETIPALVIYFIDYECGLMILIFHYFYELIATDSLLEHNPNISYKPIIQCLAIGQFHLEHHRKRNKNFGFTITLWDHIFGTYALYSNVK